MQNVRDYLMVKLHTQAKSLEKAIAQPNFKGFIILDENLVQTNHYTPTIVHDKPIAIGVSILELVNKKINLWFFASFFADYFYFETNIKMWYNFFLFFRAN